MGDYKQFDIIWAQFPLSDKIDKLKHRPAIIVSNQISNNFDNDIMVCPITSKIRGDNFSVLLTENMMTNSLDLESEIRCNKVTTIRNTLIISKVGELLPQHHAIVLKKIQSAFGNDIKITN